MMLYRLHVLFVAVVKAPTFHVANFGSTFCQHLKKLNILFPDTCLGAQLQGLNAKHSKFTQV